MPSSQEVLASLATIANDAFSWAVAWHVVGATALFAVALGWRPSRRAVTLLSCLLLASVSAVAWIYENPFNGSVFALLATTVAVLATRVPNSSPSRPPPWAFVLGTLLIVFAWVYPHFLEPSRSPLVYLYGAPLGLLPCPTLSFVLGIAIVAGAPGGRPGSLVLGTAGGYYALTGAVRLGVWIDLVLLAGAFGLVVLALRRSADASPHTPGNGGTRLA